MILRIISLVLGGYALGVASLVNTAGFQLQTAADPDDQPLKVGVWYPSDAPPGVQPGLNEPVAMNGAAIGDGLPLIIISHGNGGSLSSHSDTAVALAEAGFVVASATHTGDNFRDQSYAGTQRWFTDRPRHIERVIDYMLMQWPERARLDAKRIGFFGFSMGGYTGLIVVGATPSFERIKAFCIEHPDEFTCKLLRRLNSEVLEPERISPSTWVHDHRVKAAVLAAPGFPYAFAPEKLKNVRVPVQMWVTEGDDRVSDGNVSVLYAMLPMGRGYRLVANAGHFAFLPPCNFSRELCTDPIGFDRAEFHHEFNQSIVSFFTQSLVDRGLSAPPQLK